jgi:hypothetical protein
MLEFVLDIDLIPFHLSLIALVLLSLAEIVGHYFNLKPSAIFKQLFPQRLLDSPLLNVKFSKLLIFVFLLLNFSVAGYFLQLALYSQQQSFVP